MRLMNQDPGRIGYAKVLDMQLFEIRDLVRKDVTEPVVRQELCKGEKIGYIPFGSVYTVKDIDTLLRKAKEWEKKKPVPVCGEMFPTAFQGRYQVHVWKLCDMERWPKELVE